MASRLMRALVGGAVAVGIMATAAGPASAEGPEGNQGCTPGYWKNHTSNWEEYAPSQPLGGVGNNMAVFRNPFANPKVNAMDNSPAAVRRYESTTALQALGFGGGSGVDGAARILLRAAVAAWLNASDDRIAYPLHRWTASTTTGEPSLYSMIDQALDSGNRNTMLALAEKLDRYNNGRGGCPLN